jgi:hypothetical protein
MRIVLAVTLTVAVATATLVYAAINRLCEDTAVDW